MSKGTKEEYRKELSILKQGHPARGQELIEEAFEFARTAHEGQFRLSGEPYISHCIHVAKILSELEMDYVSISAGIMHDVIEDTEVTLDQLKEKFPEPIPLLVEGVTKISEISFRSPRERYVENIRKMLLAMSKDIRVIIIKLSDRLHNMQTLGYLPQEKQKKIARDTLEIYAPLANRLGISRIRGELEDLAMERLYPREYKKIKDFIADKKVEREKYIEESCAFLQNYLNQYGLYPQITGRAKHIYSIYRKIERQNIDISEVFDLIALRVITDNEQACWSVLGRIHSLWPPIPDRFKDYISMPKENLYRSIHTTVVGPDGQPVEIQIRDKEMHRLAETGVAAHWKYKEGVKVESDIEETLRWLRQVTEWIREEENSGDFIAALKEEVFADTIFCFTPKGDVIDLPKGATPIDFAYKIHTDIGNSCKGALVNNKMVSLRTCLNNGDIIRILRGKDAHPSPDWLEIATTPSAKAKIRRYIRSQKYTTFIEMGKESLQKALRQCNVNIPLEEIEKNIPKHFKKLNVKSYEQLLAEIGFGALSPQTVAHLFKPEPPPLSPTSTRSVIKRKKGPGIILENVGDDRDINIRLARCCLPIQGDEIIGFITVNRGIAIHRKDCPSLQRTLEEIKPDKSRIIPARWIDGKHTQQRITLRIVGWDRVGLMKDIAEAITSIDINILASSSKSYPGKKQAVINMLITVDSKEQFSRLIKRLETIPGLISASRTRRHW